MSERSNRKAILFCFCAPTASGKSTICRALCEQDPALRLSISSTTRTARPGEEEGVHYYFLSEEEFLARIAKDAFIEHAAFGGKRYGTERKNIEDAERSGVDLILDIDVQGVRRLKTLYPDQVITTFVFPPSFQVLEDRLLKRGTESRERREERLKLAREELRVLRSPGFSEYLLINDDLDSAIRDAKTIILAERQRFTRYGDAQLRKLFGEG